MHDGSWTCVWTDGGCGGLRGRTEGRNNSGTSTPFCHRKKCGELISLRGHGGRRGAGEVAGASKPVASLPDRVERATSSWAAHLPAIALGGRPPSPMPRTRDGRRSHHQLTFALKY